MKYNVYQIRYNVSSKNECERWRLIENGNEYLVSEIFINGYTYTTKDWIKEINDYKWHISCEGYCDIVDGVAYIKTRREKSALIRHLLKTVSYCVLGTLVTFISAYAISSSIQISSLLSITEFVIKSIIYFLHERMWYRSDFGVKNKNMKKN